MALDGQGFHVEIERLEAASRAMGAIADKQAASELEDLCGGDAQAVGSDVMCDALVSYCEKMSEGIDHLVDKAEDVRDGLTEAARIYREAERANTGRLTSDPAAQAMGDAF